jgi:hemerythrin
MSTISVKKIKAELQENEVLVRDALQEMRISLRSERKFLQAVQIKRILRSNRKYKKFVNRVAEEAIADDEVRTQAIGDGKILELIFQWLANGGLELILDLFL